MAIEPGGYLYEREGKEPVTRPKPSTYFKSRGYTETPLYKGVVVAEIAKELRLRRDREAELGTLLGRLCVALITGRGATVQTPPVAAEDAPAPAQTSGGEA